MKVFNLGCAEGHRFEGWFASEADYLSQAERGLTACPLCASAEIQRFPSAPHVHRPKSLNQRAPDAHSGISVKGGATEAPAEPGSPTSLPALEHAAHAAHLQAMRRVLADTADVGAQFPEEARRIHYGEAPERSIRGQATADEARALIDEGISVLPLLLPAALKGTVQ